MSFTDQKSRIATEEDCNGKWSGKKPGEGFRCYLCGHKFIVGDVWRWVYSIGKGYINFLTCEKCDGSDVLDRWVKHVKEGEQKYWWHDNFR